MALPPPETERLAFAPFTEADAPDLAEILSHPEVVRGIMTRATTPDQCLRQKLCHSQGKPQGRQ